MQCFWVPNLEVVGIETESIMEQKSLHFKNMTLAISFYNGTNVKVC